MSLFGKKPRPTEEERDALLRAGWVPPLAAHDDKRVMSCAECESYELTAWIYIADGHATLRIACAKCGGNVIQGFFGEPGERFQRTATVTLNPEPLTEVTAALATTDRTRARPL